MRRFLVRELAEEIDVNPRDVIELAHDCGCCDFSTEGIEVDYCYLESYDRMTDPRIGRIDDLGEVELELSPEAVERLAYLAGVDLQTILSLA